MSISPTEDLPWFRGVLAGIVAWVLGYAITYAFVAPEIRESPLHQIIEALDGAPATYEMVGWVFYNAHFVNTVFRDVPLLGSYTTSFIGGEDEFSFLLYLIPIVLLFGVGLALAWSDRSPDAARGALAGATAVLGYLLASVPGAFLFEVTFGGARGSPDLVPAILLAGVAYPVIVAGAGGALGGVFSSTRGPSRTEG